MALKAKCGTPNVSLMPQVTPGFLLADDLPKKGGERDREILGYAICDLDYREATVVSRSKSCFIPFTAASLCITHAIPKELISTASRSSGRGISARLETDVHLGIPKAMRRRPAISNRDQTQKWTH